MPITTTIRITIVRAGGRVKPLSEPDPADFSYPVEGRVKIVESGAADSCTYALTVNDWHWPAPPDNEVWQATVAASDARQLQMLLDRLPAHSMAAPVCSKDGRRHELMVIGEGEPLAFVWQNTDWQQDTGWPQADWERVAAVVDKIFVLVDRWRPQPEDDSEWVRQRQAEAERAAEARTKAGRYGTEAEAVDLPTFIRRLEEKGFAVSPRSPRLYYHPQVAKRRFVIGKRVVRLEMKYGQAWVGGRPWQVMDSFSVARELGYALLAADELLNEEDTSA